MDDDPAVPIPLTLAAMLEALAARIDRLHDGTTGLLLRAVPVKSGGTGRIYAGFVYAQLRDGRTQDAIDARIPERLAAELEWNREAVFAGLLRFKPGRGGVHAAPIPGLHLSRPVAWLADMATGKIVSASDRLRHPS